MDIEMLSSFTTTNNVMVNILIQTTLYFCSGRRNCTGIAGSGSVWILNINVFS